MTNQFQASLWIFRGSRGGLETPAAPAFEAPKTGSAAGFGMIGDVNGDGFTDFAVGFPVVGDDTGEVLVFHGGPALRWSAPAQTLVPDAPRSSFGFFGRGSSDFNHDGFDDLLIGAPHFSVRGSHNGRAQLFLGSASGLQTNAAWTAIYPFKARPNVDGDIQYFGNFFAVDDFNQDGLCDATISAPFASENDQGEGMTFGYYGIRRSPGLPATFDWTVQANRGSSLGLMIDKVGDVNGDGYPDLLVGAPDFGNQHIREGLAAVFFGSRRGFSEEPDWTLESNDNHCALGLYGAGVGDVNGDGFDDLVVSQNGSGSLAGFYPEAQGAIRIIYGSPIGPRNSAGVTFKKPALQWFAEEWRRLSPARKSVVVVSGFALLAFMSVAGRRIWKKRTIILVERRERESRAEERERLARDLHDELGSHLSRIHLIAELVRVDPSNPGSVRRHSQEISREAAELRVAMGQVVNSLRLGDDSLDGFVDAISAHAETFFSETPVKLHERYPVDLTAFRISPEVKAVMFPAVREALNNVFRHSRATELWIRVVIDPVALSIHIEDNGIGFEATKRSGNGIANFRERMRQIGGEVRIASTPGKGTSVRFTLRLPLLTRPVEAKQLEVHHDDETQSAPTPSINH